MPSVSGCAMTSPRRAAGEQALRPPDQYHDHDRVDDEGAELRDVIFSRHVADAEQERGEERTGDAGGAADRHHDQEVDHEFQGERGVEAENFRPEGAAQSCQAGTNGKGDGEHAFHMNAEAAGDAWIVDRSPQAAAEAGPRQDELQRDRQQPADDDDEQAVLSDIEAEQVDLALQHAGQLDVLLLRPHDVIDRRHRHEHEADGEQHLVEMRLGIDVNVEGALEQRPNGGRYHEGQRQRGKERNAIAVDQDERDIAARHGERAVGEIDEIHQAERDGKPTGQHEQQHAVGDSIEQNGQHEMTAVPTALRAPAPGPDGPGAGPPAKSGGEGVSRLLLGGSLDRVLDGIEGREFDVVQFPADLLNLAHIHVLHDVPGVRIDRDRAARTLPFQAFHGVDQGIAIGRAVGLLQRLVDQVHAVVAADRHEVRAEVVGLLEGLYERLVLRRQVRRRVEVRRHGADHDVAHAVEQVVVGHVARADDLDAGLVQPALDELLDELGALAGWHEHEDGVRLGVGRALQERREVRARQGELDLADDLAPRLGEGFLER